MPIQDLARDDVVKATPGTPAVELARMMRDESVGSVVITEDDYLVGIVTDRDLATRVLAEGRNADNLTAKNVMTSDVCSVNVDAGFHEAAQTMSENGIRRLPICNENDELVGIITVDDLTELLADEQAQLAAVVRAQRPAY